MKSIFRSIRPNFSKFDIRQSQLNGRSIYLDNAATTQMDPWVLEKMLPWMVQKFGNPHSRSHMFGWEAEKAVEQARENIAGLINADQKEIIFTSGATESNNLAIKGMAGFYGTENKDHFITSQIEHKCVLDSFRYLENKGFKVTYLPVNKEGLVDPHLLESAITDRTIGVSIHMVNNEISVVQKIKEIGQICKDMKVILHCDMAQTFGKIPVDMDDLGVDMASFSGHKIYGPKGIGALFIRRKGKRVKIHPLLSGGGQERGLRSGTLPSYLCIGLGEAANIAQRELEWDLKHVTKMSQLFQEIVKEIPCVYFNGSKVHGYPGILNFSIEFVEGESLIMSMKNVAISSGSACTSASLEPSYVLRALGVQEDLAHTSIRFGIGRFTTEEEVKFTAELLKKRVELLRELSPLWEDRLEQVEWTGGKGKI